ncbi:TPA: hypothetical protein KLD42_002834 [Legionella pneumophila]|nr:hypothetical protein [Legionella pneumophila]
MKETDLFSDKTRVELRGATYGEHPFDYLDSSARKEAQDIRTLLQEAFDKYPKDEAIELKQRIQARDVNLSQSASFELILHHLLIKQGFNVEVHPDVSGCSTSPDFLITSIDGQKTYIEAVKLSELGNERETLEKQKNLLFDEINEKFHGVQAYLSISVLKQSKVNFPRKMLFSEITACLEKLNEFGTDKIEGKWESPKKDWVIEFKLCKCDKAPQKFISCIYPYMAQVVNVPKIINRAFQKKASKYGQLLYPLVLAINVNSSIMDDIDELEGLFGKERFVFTEDGVEFAGRQKNGAWVGPNGFRNKRVSGAWLFHNLTEWRLNKRHYLYINPYTEKSLFEEFYSSLPTAIVNSEGRLIRNEGKKICDLLGINWNWLDN